MTIRIYRITVTQAPQIHDCNTHFALEAWGGNTREYTGHDDGGEMYALPEKYSLGRSVDGSLRIYDARDMETALVGSTYPAVSNETGLAERLGRA